MTKALLAVGLLAAVACATGGAPATARPPVPTPEQIAATCWHQPLRDEGGKNIPFVAQGGCALAPGPELSQVDYQALRQVAPIGVLLEREEMAVVTPVQNAGTWTVNVYFAATPDDPAFADLLTKPRVRRMNVRSFVTPAQHAALRWQLEMIKEENVYASCRARVLDVALSAREPEHAQSCGRAMDVIDRARASRVASAQHAEVTAIERERVYLEGRGVAAMEQANSLRRWETVSRSLERMAPSPGPPVLGRRVTDAPWGRREVETDCRPTFAGGMRCTSR